MATKIKTILKSLGLMLLYGFLINGYALAGSCNDPNNPDARDCLADGKPGEVMKLLSIGLNVMAAAVGVLAVILLIVAGIQYTTSAGDPNKVAEAKKRIYNVILGVFAFIFLYAFLQWLIPGGIEL